jgi:hypothetical protein
MVMKWVQILLSIGPLAFGVYAQGVVDFNNNRVFATTADRLIYDYPGGAPLVGTNYVAQLYYGTGASSLVPVTSAPARFRVPTTAVPGTWSGGIRTLTGFTAGMTATLQVAVWDSNAGPTLEQARALGAFWGLSQTFTYTVPAPGSPPGAYYIENFRAFMMIPEPSIIGLGVLGALALFVFRRRTSS